MISWYISQASSFAQDIDGLILLITVIVGVFFLAAQAAFFWLIWRYRARDGVRAQYVTGETAREKRWVSYPHYLVLVFDIVILVGAIRVWHDVKIDAPPADEQVRIIAQQWAWTFVHAGPDGRLDTDDDIRTVDELNLQTDRLYHFELHSRDVLHSFSVPAFRLKQDAVPGRAIRGWFRPTRVGEYDVQCAEICGIGHGLMPARVFVRPAAEHSAWMATAPRLPAAGSPALAQLAATQAEHTAHDHAAGHEGVAQ